MKNALLWICYPAFLVPAYGQGNPNYIRNGSFEQFLRANYPRNEGEIDKCRFWEEDFSEDGDEFSVDWYRNRNDVNGNGRDYMHGGIRCDLNPTIQANLHSSQVPDFEGECYVGALMWEEEGEAFRQRMRAKLPEGIYEIRFHYLLPCSDWTYGFDIFLSRNQNSHDFHAIHTALPDTTIGQWHEYRSYFYVAEDREFDWFFFKNDSRPLESVSPDSNAYLYIDDIHIEEAACENCSPSGPISYNPAIPDHFMPNFDGVRTYPMDYWCITNINNVTGIDFWIVTRDDNIVYEKHYYNPNGFYDFDICWDGTTRDNVAIDYSLWAYAGVARFYNCSDYVARDGEHSNPVLFTVFPVIPNVDGIYVNQFTIQPPGWGQLSLPFAPPHQHLYGGNWDGVHNWYACDEIFTGGNEHTHIQYFRVGVNSITSLFAGNAIVLGPGTYFDFGSTVYVRPDSSIQCCPTFRSGAPMEEYVPEFLQPDTAGALQVEPAPAEVICPSPFVNAFPNPVEDVLYFQSGCLPEETALHIEVTDLLGRRIMEIELVNGMGEMITAGLPAGTYVWRVKEAEVGLQGRVVKL